MLRIKRHTVNVMREEDKGYLSKEGEAYCPQGTAQTDKRERN